MVKTQIYFREEELEALHEVSERSGRSVAALVREAVQERWLKEAPRGPVALWKGQGKLTSMDHDRIYDQP